MTNREQDLIQLASKGGNDAALMLLDKISALEDEITALKNSRLEIPKFPEFPAIPNPLAVSLPGVELVTLKGDPGEPGQAGEKGGLGERGLPGKDGRDGFSGADGRDGVDGKDGMDGTNGQDASFDSQLFQDEITKLRTELTATIAEQTKRPIFGPGKTRVVTYDLSSLLDGATKTFFLGTHFGIISVNASGAPFGAFRPTVDYVESGKNIVFDPVNVDAPSALAQGQSLVVRALR